MRQESDIIARVREGDAKSFRELFRLHYEALCSFAMSIVKRWDLAEDAVSTVMQEVWEKRETLRDVSTLRPYLYRAVRNRCLNLIREEANMSALIDASSVGNEGVTHPELDGRLRMDELRAAIERLIGDLPEQQRITFCMSRFDNMRYKEIAHVMGISEYTVQNHVMAAMRRLERSLPQLRAYLG